MNGQVVVTANEQGQVVVTSTNNPVYGFVRVESEEMIIGPNRFVRPQKKSALILGRIEHLQMLNYKKGQQLPGRIRTIETLTPVNPEDLQQGLKLAGPTNVVCKIEGKPIYRLQEYDPSGESKDVLIAHDNKAEIQQEQKVIADRIRQTEPELP